MTDLVATFRVFVSSTWLDLQPERTAVEKSLQRVRQAKYIGMEYFGSRDETTRAASIAEVDRCDLYVGIIAGRYGSGITESEYRRARQRGLPCFIYIKPDASIADVGREADADAAAKLAALKDDLRRSHGVSEFANPDDLAARVTADLHRWLTEDLLAADRVKVTRNELPGDRAQALLAGLSELAALVRELQQTARSSTVQATGERSIAVGGSNTGIVCTGDIVVQMFANARPSLAQQIRVAQFKSLIEERTREFVGRDHVFAAIDDWLKDDDFASGYITIQGEPGIGKTALASELVKRRGYVHHFNVAAQNIRSTRDFLSNVCAQLIVRYQLDHDALPPEAASDSGFLAQLLHEAAARSLGNPVVVVVDALDEAEDSELSREANILYLPPSLPDGVYFVLTSRERAEYRLSVDRREPIHLRENDPQSRADVRAYVVNFIDRHRDEMARRIADWELSENAFVDMLIDRSEGNFMYLVHVLPDIRRGRLSKSNVGGIQNLPHGLREYYRRHWRAMRKRDPDEFDREYAPLVCFLATAREPVSLDDLAGWTHLPVMRVRHLMDEWREFLNEDATSDGTARYRIYHTSFQDFLRDEVALASYHSAIADVALAKIRGFSRLSEGSRSREAVMSTPLSPNPVAGLSAYEFANLTAHLVNAGRIADALQLLRLDWLQALATGQRERCRNAWYEAQLRADPSGDRYWKDILRVRAAAEKADAQAATAREPMALLGPEVRLALLLSTIRSLAGQVPRELLVALVASGDWLPAQGFAAATRIPDHGDRAAALAALAPHLPEIELNSAIAAAHALDPSESGTSPPATALIGLTPRLAELGRTSEAIQLASVIRDATQQAAALEAICRKLLSQGQSAEALRAAAAIRDAGSLGRFLAEVEGELPDASLSLAIEIAQERLTTDHEKHEPADSPFRLLPPRRVALLALLPRLALAGQPQRAFELALTFAHPDDCAALLGSLAQWLPDELVRTIAARPEVWLDEACVGSLASRLAGLGEEWRVHEPTSKVGPGAQAYALGCLAQAASGSVREALLGDARTAALSARETADQCWALRRLCTIVEPPLRERLLGEALELAQGITKTFDRDRVVRALAIDLAKSLDAAKMLELLRSCWGTPIWPEVMAATLDYLPSDVLATIAQWYGLKGGEAPKWPSLLVKLGRSSEALSQARALPDRSHRILALARLAPSLTGEWRFSALNEALDLTRVLDEGKETFASAPMETALARTLGVLAEEDFAGEALEILSTIEGISAKTESFTTVAPFLTAPRLFEWIEFADSLPLDHERARLLTEVGLRAHALGFAAEALKIGSRIDDGFSKQWYLTSLATQFGRLGLAAEAESAIMLIDDRGTRAEAYAALAAATSLPNDVLDWIHHTLLANRDRGESCIKALVQLGVSRPEALADDAVQTFLRNIRDAAEHDWMIRDVVPLLPDPLRERALADLLPAMLQRPRGLEQVSYKCWYLAWYAKQLSPPLVSLALDAARAADEDVSSDAESAQAPGPADAFWRAKRLAVLAEHASIVNREELAAEVFRMASAVGDAPLQAVLMAGIAPMLPIELQPAALERTKSVAIDIARKEVTQHRALVFSWILPGLMMLDAPTLHRVWREILHAWAGRARSELWGELVILLPVVKKLGGSSALAETARAIRDLGRWWGAER